MLKRHRENEIVKFIGEIIQQIAEQKKKKFEEKWIKENQFRSGGIISLMKKQKKKIVQSVNGVTGHFIRCLDAVISRIIKYFQVSFFVLVAVGAAAVVSIVGWTKFNCHSSERHIVIYASIERLVYGWLQRSKSPVFICLPTWNAAKPNGVSHIWDKQILHSFLMKNNICEFQLVLGNWCHLNIS